METAGGVALCIRCGEAPVVDENGYCGSCHWATRAEAVEGIEVLRKYLGGWAAFAAYCVANDLPNPTS